MTAADGRSYNCYFNADGVDFRWIADEEQAFPPRLEAELARSSAALKRRPDDASADAVIKRIDTFLETTQPLITYFDEQGILRKVNADQSIEAVWADIVRVLDARSG